MSIFKGYYLILPPQYSSKGILPLTLFLDTFMKFLERPYYVALLNAALTATDLVQFERRIGGLNRATTVLNELADVLSPTDF